MQILEYILNYMKINKKTIKFDLNLILPKKLKISLYNLYSQRLSNDAPLINITCSNFDKDGANLDALKI